eukprot:549259-Rhodomonas_salina.1
MPSTELQSRLRGPLHSSGGALERAVSTETSQGQDHGSRSALAESQSAVSSLGSYPLPVSSLGSYPLPCRIQAGGMQPKRKSDCQVACQGGRG